MEQAVSAAVISRAAIENWPAGLLAGGYRVIAPVATAEGEAQYAELRAGSAAASAMGVGLPRLSPKGAWFPRSEPILHIQRNGRRFAINDPAMQFPPSVIFGARACDAAAPQVLAPLFGWDFHDAFFEQRLASLAFVVMACKGPIDDACFCTSVDVDPAGANVGDVVLTELEDGTFFAEARTDKGRKLLETIPESDKKPAAAPPASLESIREKARESVAKTFDPKAVREALKKRFDDPIWGEFAKSCLACGTCAFACPTCHCFDIQDESAGKDGIRQKNWDACAFPLFTLHTSGHNPRPDQGSRWRQRLSHKFRYYPEKFRHVLCTGCGRCMRLCPAGMDMLADLIELQKGNGSSTTDRNVCPTELAADENVCPTEPLGPVPGILASNAGASANVYRPYLMKVADLRDETPDVRTLKLEFADAKEGEKFDFRVGQFGLYGAMGEGESTFCIASASTRKGYIECTFRQAGRVTRALRRLNVGDTMGFRGPYGNSFPVEGWKGKDLLFIAGGIALPPMRSVIQYCMDKREDYGDIVIIYGARTWADHVYKDELAEWEKRPDVKLWLCIDWKVKNGALAEEPADEGWRPLNLKSPGESVLDESHRRYTGFVPHLVEAVKPPSANRIAVLCGPPIMIKLGLASLKKLGYESQNVFTTLENRMKCGIGKCGRCNVGPIYICKEGPVFTAKQVEAMPAEM